MNWQGSARRIRVPLGFLLAAIFLWLARPAYISLACSLLLVVPGLAIRVAASGHVKKNRELTTTGPYAYTRNPLYLGSILIGVGFALAARSPWFAIALLVMFLAVYMPVIRSEEELLQTTFSNFGEYRRQVPRLLPRFNPASLEHAAFSARLYLQHREYNAIIGAAALYAALLVKLVLISKSILR